MSNKSIKPLLKQPLKPASSIETYFAVCARGIEPVAAAELTVLGAKEVTTGRGGVHFQGDQALLYQANLWARTITRIYKPLREFSAKHREMLYDQVRRIHWEEFLDPEMTFSVACNISEAKGSSEVPDATGPETETPRTGVRRGGPKDRKPQKLDQRNQKRLDRQPDLSREGAAALPERDPKALNHSHYAALKIKDAIVDRLRTKYGARPNVDTNDPDLRLHAYIQSGRCTISLDSTGNSLHERGYRTADSGAPLRETLAAAIVHLSGWDAKTPFLDPMCGSGTLAIEAALQGLNIAPGLSRDKFGFMGWPDFNSKLWEELREEAYAKQLHKLPEPIVGYDADRRAITGALENRATAGLEKNIHFEVRELSELQPVGRTPGVVIMNPPYGERMGADAELPALYKLIGDMFKQRMKGWTGFIFTGNLEAAKSVGLKTSRRIELFNGPIECRLLKYDLY